MHCNTHLDVYPSKCADFITQFFNNLIILNGLNSSIWPDFCFIPLILQF